MAKKNLYSRTNSSSLEDIDDINALMTNNTNKIKKTKYSVSDVLIKEFN